MKFFNHIQYFLYISINWGLKIGIFTILREIQGEKKYQLNTTSYHKLSSFKIKGKHLKDATEYMPVNYFTIEKLLARLPNEIKNGIFLDIGCGKGRAMCVAAHFGFLNLLGIDFAKEMIDAAEINLRKTKEIIPEIQYNLLWTDVEELEIRKEVSCIFLFNPFNYIIMEMVIEKINTSLKKYPRPFYLLYASPLYAELFYAADFDVLFRLKKLNYLDAVILTRK